jgi:hypothetical protein
MKTNVTETDRWRKHKVGGTKKTRIQKTEGKITQNEKTEMI